MTFPYFPAYFIHPPTYVRALQGVVTGLRGLGVQMWPEQSPLASLPSARGASEKTYGVSQNLTPHFEICIKEKPKKIDANFHKIECNMFFFERENH